LKTWTNSNIWIVMGRNYQAVSTPQRRGIVGYSSGVNNASNKYLE